MRYIGTLLLTMFLVSLSLPVFGGGYGTLTSVELKAMIDRNESGLLVIDSRSQGQYEETHIKGAISIPLDVMEKSPQLPGVQKDAKIVFYCSGST